MKEMSTYALEELSINHKDMYPDYFNSFSDNKEIYLDFFSVLFNGKGFLKFEDITKWYEANRNSQLGLICKKLNNEQNESYFSSFDLPHKIYLLVRKTDNKLIGVLSIYCTYDCLLEEYVTQMSYEIRPDERSKKHGELLVKRFLATNDIDLDKILVRIYDSNLNSIKLINKFNPELIGTKDDYIYERKIMYYRINVPSK